MHMFRTRRAANEKGPSEDKPYSSLRNLRSPFRSVSPAKRRSRSLELEVGSPPPEATHARHRSTEGPAIKPSIQTHPRPLSTATNGTTGRISRDNSAQPEASGPSTTKDSENVSPTAPKKKPKRLAVIVRAITGFRNFSPGRRSPAATSAGHPEPESPARRRALQLTKLDSWLPHRLLPHTRSRSASPTNNSQAPEQHIDLSASESVGIITSAPVNTHLPNSASDPGRSAPVLNIIEPTPPRVSVRRGRRVSADSYFNGNESGAEASPLSAEEQHRAEKRERRRSPLARLASPRLFRRDSADGRTVPPRVGSPILPLKSRVADGNKLRISESMTNIDDSNGATRRGVRQGRHNSFDYVPERERPASGIGAGKVRFVQETDSGVSGVESEGSSGRIPTQQSVEDSSDNGKGKQPESSGLARNQSVKVNGEKDMRRPRPRSSPPPPPPGASATSSNTTRGLSGANGRVPTTRGPISGPMPMGGLSNGTLLPHFEFESVVSGPVPSPARSTFGASLPVSTRVKDKRPRPDENNTTIASAPGLSSSPADVRRGKGRSLDLGIGLLWAPQRVREDAVMTFGGAGAHTRNKWALDPRMSELYIGEGEAAQFGAIKANRDQVLRVYRDTLGEQADLTFRRYLRRYETGAIPLRGPTGLMAHVDRLLDSAPAMNTKHKETLLNDLSRVIAPS